MAPRRTLRATHDVFAEAAPNEIVPGLYSTSDVFAEGEAGGWRVAYDCEAQAATDET